MPSEVRNIVFEREEIVRALTAYRKRKGKPIPSGTVFKYVIESEPAVRVALAVAVDGEDRLVHLEFPSEEVGAALVMHCIQDKIPLPARGARKALQVVGDCLSLVVSIGTPSAPLNGLTKTD